MWKRLFSVVLLIALLLPLLNYNGRTAYAENTPEEMGYITEVTGLTHWDKVWIKETISITEDITITGDVKLEPGASIIITSGRLVIESQASVNGDIYIEESGLVEIWGTVTGTVYVNSTNSSVQAEDWDGSLVRARNFTAYDSSDIGTVILNGVGTGFIDGKVGSLIITENYDGDYGCETNCVVQKLEYYGNTDFYNCGHIYEAYVTGGKSFSNNTGATIDRIIVSGGTFGNLGLVHFAVVEKAGCISNNNNGELQFEESLIENVVVREDAEVLMEGDEVLRNLTNFGNITSLIAYGGEICVLGDVDYFYADGCRKIFIETCSWRQDRGTDYQVEYLYAKDSEVYFQDYTDYRTQKPKVRTARLENGYVHAVDLIAEELYLDGVFSGIYLERVEVYDLYIDSFDLFEGMTVDVPVPEKVIITDFMASTEASDVYEQFTAGMYDALSEENQKLLKEFSFETKDLSGSGREISEKVFTKTLEPYEIIGLDFTSDEVTGAVLVESPSGYEFMVMSRNTPESKSFLAYEGGEYTFRILGDKYGAELSVEITKSANINLDVYTQYAVEHPEDAVKNKASLSEFKVKVYDLTEDKEITSFLTEGEEVLFQDNPKGHTFALTLTSTAMRWEFEPLTLEFVLNEGESKDMEAVVKQYGDYYGYTADGAVPQVYFYDENGAFVRRADGDSYGNFWAGRLPSGQYTAILLRDDTGNYMFSNLSDFEIYGLVEKEDYLKDTFVLEAGLNINYPDIELTDAPKVENIYFDTNVTAVNTNRPTTVPGELIQVTLDYTVRPEYADRISALMFRFVMSEGTEFKEGSVILNGKVVSDYDLENGVLRVVADDASGTICYQISASETDITLLNNASAEFILKGKEIRQLIGMASTYITALSAKIQTVTANGEISVTGYAAPHETVSVLDNKEVIWEVEANSSGYFSTVVSLPKNISRHKVCVAKEVGTPAELRTDEQVVSIMDTAPQLLDFYMYYYVHGHSAQFHLSGEEFSTKRFIYDYWPGSVFTFELKMSESDSIDKLYVVSNNGSVKKLEAFYDAAEDLWVASGIFSEDENYAPADFDIEYKLKEIDIATEIGDFNLWRDMSVDTAVIDEMYESADKNFSEYVYDEERNMVSNTLTVSYGETEYTCDYSISYQATEETKETLLAQGYEVEKIDGTEYFYKMELDYATWLMTTTMAVFVNTEEEQALAGELMLFSIQDADEIRGPALLQQVLQCNVRDVIVNQISAMPDIAKDLVFDSIPKGIDVVKDVSEQFEAWEPIIGPDKFLTEKDREKLDKIKEVFEWVKVVFGVDALNEQQKYYDKLKEMERKLDAIEQARQEGKGGKCALIPLDSFYDDIQASYKAIGDLTNAKWSLAWIKKTVTSGVDAALSAKGPVKKKLPDGTFENVSVKDALKIKRSAAGKEGIDKVLINQQNLWLEKIQDYFSVSKWYEKGMDAMAGDTLEYWTAANSKHLEQLEANINAMFILSGANQTSGPGLQKYLKSSAAIEPLLLSGNNGCYEPKDVEPYPGGTVPGGGGEVRWDPSGYVFEGVPSNRLAGVTATTYYRGKDGSEIIWDAEEYGQINPQITDSKGCYGWFVSEGDWKVVYEKDGYEVASTKWLPVPPPQTEVNVGLVSQDAPAVQSVVISPKGAWITFSKYVKAETVTDSRLFINNTSGKIEAVNAEADADGTLLASKFCYTPEGTFTAGTSYTVTIKEGITGYNNKSITGTELSAVCSIQPEGIYVELPDYLIVGKDNTIKVTIDADGGFDSMKLLCSGNEKFLEVVSIGSVSADGTADVVIKAKKAGVSLMTLSVAECDVVLDVDVVSAGEQDIGLMKYIEREKQQAEGITQMAEEPKENNMMLWIVLAAVVLVIGTGISIIFIKKCRKTK